MSDISKLNDHLFSQLERLDNSDLKGDALEQEINRTSALTSIAKEVISAGALVVSAEKVRQEFRSPMNGNNLLEKIK